MKRGRWRISWFAGLIALFAAGAVHAQGDLTPPGGPAPSMKSLDQVEPRTPISSLPYRIEESGSYYLTGPLASTSSGILISTNDVTLDLMGFAISGTRTLGYHGINIGGSPGSPVRRVVVRNGTVHSFITGVRADHAEACRIERMMVSTTLGSGIYLDAW